MGRNVLDETKRKMEKLTAKRAAELENVTKKKAEAERDLAAALEDMETATTEMNLEAYEKASARKSKAQAGVDMYTARIAQISKAELIGSEESDGVLNGLVKYEDQLEAGLVNGARETLQALVDNVNQYFDQVSRAESLYHEWTRSIRDREKASVRPDGYCGSILAGQI